MSRVEVKTTGLRSHCGAVTSRGVWGISSLVVRSDNPKYSMESLE